MTTSSHDSTRTGVFRLIAILWFIWGAVHILAGVMTLSSDTAKAVQGIADAVDPALLLDVTYPAAAGGVIDQHGFNLLWFGVVTAVCAFFVWRGSMGALFIAALVGGLADVGYFVFIDLAGFAKFFPGTVMTIVSGTAIAASLWVYWTGRGASSPGG
ncbi:MAG: hypothetical protein AAFX50_07085 [Acidobacteriota bacterium]